MEKIDRQAVIIVHGMGEQRPMDTLRSFVKGVKWQMEQLDPDETVTKVRSKPDSIGDVYETVRLSMESNYKTQRPITDFYEFYWAHNMRQTNFTHMQTWLVKVVFTPYKKVPKRLRPVWMTLWGVTLACMIVVGLFTFMLPLPIWLQTVITVFGGGLFSLLIGTIGNFIKSTFLKSLGDVARYMTPVPDNIAERSHIRQQGITFLEKLHKISNRTKPDRIIVVAHSLGSVVAYDLLRLLWTEYNTRYDKPPKAQPMAKAVDDFAVHPETIDHASGNFADSQNAYWNEARELGNPWLITDFITLGAPLHALDYLMVNKESFDDLVTERELPVCPPEIDAKDNSIFYRQYFESADGKPRKGIDVPHHGALFSMARWTNIFYTSDFVGGPLQPLFGKGVKDLPIAHQSAGVYPKGHTDYWTGGKPNLALEELVKALRLNH